MKRYLLTVNYRNKGSVEKNIRNEVFRNCKDAYINYGYVMNDFFFNKNIIVHEMLLKVSENNESSPRTLLYFYNDEEILKEIFYKG